MEISSYHSLIVGSGAAGLNAALQLHRKGIEDIAIITEGLHKGTSINTGSDKQTYYKLSLSGFEGDSPRSMAEVYYKGGGMHGDLALTEAAGSPGAFLNLVNLGVPFPTDRYGQYAGYKTDHDPARRATSIGPYTSKEMCLALMKEVKKAGIPILENRDVIDLITVREKKGKRAAGLIALGEKGEPEVYRADNVLFAAGGPGGLYRTSVYPGCHTGAIGLALREGAMASNLPESQFGLASVKFRWNLSGTYMQVLPRFVSVDPRNEEDEKEFLRDYFSTAGEMNSRVFLKGYQWPFDSAKVLSGSSIIDILVFRETVEKGRKVYLDFRTDPKDFSFGQLSSEAADYLSRSEALLPSPFERLEKMNPGAIDLYLDHHIDLRKEMLEIAVCAQHNNGGLAADIWWQSENIAHLFPIGEVNGSHGVNRPGGSALNSGQVGGFRATEYIAAAYREQSLDGKLFRKEAERRLASITELIGKGRKSQLSWKKERLEFQDRMSGSGAFIREEKTIRKSLEESRRQLERLEREASSLSSPGDIREYFRNRHLCFAHWVYLEAILFSLVSGTGSRGSGLVLSRKGDRIEGMNDAEWLMVPEDTGFRNKVQKTCFDGESSLIHDWEERREIPEDDLWFEKVWHDYRNKEIYK